VSAQMATAPVRPVPLTYRAAGAAGLVLAVLIMRLPFERATALVAFLGRRARPATGQEADAAVAAARRAARWFPGRAACLETSLAAVITARLHGRRLDWCIGARQLPFAAHAWVEAGHGPIGEPADRPYSLLLRV
jgi:hypothetical protein